MLWARQHRRYLIAALATLVLVLVAVQIASAYTNRLREYRFCNTAQYLSVESDTGLFLKTTVQIPAEADLVGARAEGNCIVATYYHSSFPLGSVSRVEVIYQKTLIPTMQEFWTVAQKGYMDYLRKLYGW